MPRIPKEIQVYYSLFERVEAILSLPLEEKSLMRKVERRLERRLRSICDQGFPEIAKKCRIKTRNGEIAFQGYLKAFVANSFDCLESCQKYLQSRFEVETDVPNTLYHGTTSKFLSRISQEGLLPLKAGRCWKKDWNKNPKEICLTDSMYAAEFFATCAREKLGGEPVVLRIGINGLKDKMRLGIELLEYEHPTVFDLSKEMCFRVPIPTNRIVHWYFPPMLSANILFVILRGEEKRVLASRNRRRELLR